MIVIEQGPPFQWKPGIFKSNVHGKRFWRIWLFWWAFAWVDMSLKQYGEFMASGDTHWVIPRG